MEQIIMLKLLDAFRFSEIQAALTMMDWLRQNNRGIEDVRKFVKNYDHTKKIKPRLFDNTGRPINTEPAKVRLLKGGCVEKTSGYVVCNACGNKTAKEYAVNTKPCNKIGGEFTRQIICNHCEHEEFK